MEDLTGKQFGHYQIVAPLGEGGMAAVYKAYQPAMERYVAIKVLPRHMANSEEFVARFKREAKLLAQLQHPHILPVFDYGESDGYTYIVMPFVQTGTLTDVIKSRRLSLGEVRRIMVQLGGALQYAHSRGMVHRDIKPSNVLIDETNNCLLTDFGLARMTEDAAKLTSSGAVMGTPAYMSPEQGMGSDVDHRSDIYSLGIILYEMVTGRVPYSAETPIAIVFKHIQDPLPPARSINPDLPEALELVLFKALAKNPEDRYQSSAEFVEAIKRAISESDETLEIAALREAPDKATLIASEVEKTASGSQPIQVQTLVGEKPEPPAETVPSQPKPAPARRNNRLPVWAILAGVAAILAVVLGGFWVFSGMGGGTPPAANQGNGAGTNQPLVEPTRPPVNATPVEQVNIIIWHNWRGNALAAAQQNFSLYEASHPGVTIELVNFPDDTTLIEQIKSGSGADLMIRINNDIGWLSREGLIVDLDSLGVERSFLESTYEPRAVQSVTWDGKAWGFPDSQESIALIYNKAVASRDDFPAIPQNFADLLEKSRKFASTNPGKYLVCNPGLAEADPYHVAPIFFGFGVPGYVSDDGKANLDSRQALDAARWLKDFKPLTFSNANYDICSKFLIEGKTAAIWTGPWAQEQLRAAGVDYGVVPMGSPFIGTVTLMISQNAVARGHQDVAVDIARFFTNTESAVNLSLSRTSVPANSAALKNPKVMGNESIQAFLTSVQSGIIMSPSPVASVQWGPMGQAISAIWNNSQTPEAALKKAQQEIEAAIAKLKP